MRSYIVLPSISFPPFSINFPVLWCSTRRSLTSLSNSIAGSGCDKYNIYLYLQALLHRVHRNHAHTPHISAFLPTRWSWIPHASSVNLLRRYPSHPRTPPSIYIRANAKLFSGVGGLKVAQIYSPSIIIYRFALSERWNLEHSRMAMSFSCARRTSHIRAKNLLDKLYASCTSHFCAPKNTQTPPPS